MNEFEKFAKSNCGINSLVLNDYQKESNRIINGSGNGWINPSIIEERQLNVAQMDVFSRLMMDRIIFLGSAIDNYTANVVEAQLLFLNSVDANKDISIYINTPGGSVYDGLGIYDTMQYISSDISTVCMGMAASMGSILLCAGTKGKRYALPHSRVMIHQPLGGISQAQCSDIQITAKEIEKCKAELFQVLADHTGQSLKKIYKDGDRDFWMTAKEALDYGIIDEVFGKQK